MFGTDQTPAVPECELTIATYGSAVKVQQPSLIGGKPRLKSITYASGAVVALEQSCVWAKKAM